MPQQTLLRLPDGQTMTVVPVFGGLLFKSNELNTHPGAFPIGWTIVIHTEEGDEDGGAGAGEERDDASWTRKDQEALDRAGGGCDPEPERRIRRFTRPTLQNDCIFISSISSPASAEYKPAASPARQIAMMLWVTLYWYFHQPPPPTALTTDASRSTPEAGRPRGEWRVRIKKDGVLRGANLMPKLERMGLITSDYPAAGTALEDTDNSWSRMFVTRRMFWQIPGRLFLFALQPVKGARSRPGSPIPSRPGSAQGQHPFQFSSVEPVNIDPRAPPPDVLTSVLPFPTGPFSSASHLPTYYPPAPLQYVMTDHVRHPLRPKPPRMGEVFYSRFIPSVGQYLAFRVASASPRPVPYPGPVGPDPPNQPHLCTLTDAELLERWHRNPRVSAFWGKYTPGMLTNALRSRHSFPAIGMWDGVPFGYFELYWVKEDLLGRHAGSDVDDWDRGCHVLVGEEWARGRVQTWLTSLVHWLFSVDYRTMSVCVEPRVDNERLVLMGEPRWWCPADLLRVADRCVHPGSSNTFRAPASPR